LRGPKPNRESSRANATPGWDGFGEDRESDGAEVVERGAVYAGHGSTPSATRGDFPASGSRCGFQAGLRGHWGKGSGVRVRGDREVPSPSSPPLGLRLRGRGMGEEQGWFVRASGNAVQVLPVGVDRDGEFGSGVRLGALPRALLGPIYGTVPNEAPAAPRWPADAPPQIVHELIERFDGHLKAEQFYSVIANMRGESPEAVADLLLNAPGLQGLQVGLGGVVMGAGGRGGGGQ
jgi:hypothetical protein